MASFSSSIANPTPGNRDGHSNDQHDTSCNTGRPAVETAVGHQLMDDGEDDESVDDQRNETENITRDEGGIESSDESEADAGSDVDSSDEDDLPLATHLQWMLGEQKKSKKKKMKRTLVSRFYNCHSIHSHIHCSISGRIHFEYYYKE